jgi:hypothetical protein
MRGIETLIAEGKKAPAKKPPPFRYLLRFNLSGEETETEFVNRNDAIARIIELKQRGASVEAFVDAKLEIGYAVKLEGIGE